MWTSVGGYRFYAWVGLSILLPGILGYEHLGCYPDKLDDRDLNSKEITYAELSVASCVDECRKDGLPYAGLQSGQRCYCGASYGQHGLYPPYRCNYTCGSVTCGGVLSNDVYYTVKTDSVAVAAREVVVYAESRTYLDARKHCIQQGGDLATLLTGEEVNTSLSAANAVETTEQTLWFGLRRRLPTGPFEWTDETAARYDLSAAGSRDNWHDSETWQNPCAYMRKDSGKWQTSNCYMTSPFMCEHEPIPDTVAPTDEDGNGYGDEEDEEFDKTKLSLFIVLPLMMLCYGGSCIAYCTSKLMKNHRRNKKKEMMRQMNGEYENKPKPPSTPRPFTPKKSVGPMPDTHTGPTAARKPMLPPPGMMGAQVPPPAFTVIPPPPKKGVPAFMNAQPAMKKQPVAAQPADRAESSSSGRSTPSYYEKNVNQDQKVQKVKEEERRRARLEQALREVRERRMREAAKPGQQETSFGARAPPPGGRSPRPGGKGSPRESMNLSDSGDSTSNLLGKEPKDPKHMSISEIMKVKVILNKHKKPRKSRIITG